MSTDQNAVTQTGPPRRFLRKGEGLKRFAAYKPPLPTTAKKVERRQTFVRFKIDPKNTNFRQEPAHFIPPDILNDDSINLSTEIPKIAPPKIIHTPIRPNRHALGTVTNESSFFTNSQINGNIDSLFKKIEEKKSALLESEENCFNDHINSFDYQDNDDDAHEIYTDHDNDDNNNDHKHDHDHDKHHEIESKEQQEQDNDSKPPRPQLLTEEPQQHRARPKRAGRITDLSTPAPGTSFVALDRQISQIEKTVNELREKLKNCECGAMAQQPPQTTRRRPTTRAAAKAAKSKESDTKSTGPLVNADNNPIEKLIISLADNVAQLRVKYDEEMEKKRQE